MESSMTEKEKSFEQVYYEYYPRILGHIRKKLSSYHEAEDLAQEIMTVCFRNFEKYDSEKASLGTWIYVVMNNRLKNYYRDKKDLVSLDDEESYLEVAAKEVLEEAVILEEQIQILMDTIEKLSEREQTIIQYTYFYRMTSAEVAERLHMTAGNVRVVLNRTLKKLKGYLEEQRFER